MPPIDKPAARPARRWIMIAAKAAIIAAVIWGVHRTFSSGLEQLREQHWTASQLRWPWLVAAAGLYLTGLVPCGVFWHRLLGVLGQNPSWGETFTAYMIGHLGKYAPGKAMVVILRTTLIRGTRVSTSVAAASVFYETLTMMAAGAMIGGLILAVRSREHAWLAGIAALFAVAAAVPTLPPVFRVLAKKLGVARSDPTAIERLSHLGYGTLTYGWLNMAASWLLVGLSLWATLAGAGYAQWPPSPADAFACIAAAALAVVAGFASLIPGGALVREAVILEVLAPVVGEAGALIGAVFVRLVWLGSELLVSAALYAARKRDAS